MWTGSGAPSPATVRAFEPPEGLRPLSPQFEKPSAGVPWFLRTANIHKAMSKTPIVKVQQNPLLETMTEYIVIDFSRRKAYGGDGIVEAADIETLAASGGAFSEFQDEPSIYDESDGSPI
jgi:hypothetical protein